MGTFLPALSPNRNIYMYAGTALFLEPVGYFQLFSAGYVRAVFSMGFGHIGARYILLKAKVNPSQRSPNEANEAWIIAKCDGEIVSAHYTCMVW
jgi:hypothetical protein